MSEVHDEGREGFEDVEHVLRGHRREPTSLQLDKMKQAAQSRARDRMPRLGGLRQRLVTAVLVTGLVVGGSGAVVIAKNGGGNDGKGNGNHGQYCPNDKPKQHDCGHHKGPKCHKHHGRHHGKPEKCPKH